MDDITLILLAAGSSSRFALPVRKQWLYQGDVPLWVTVAERFRSFHDFGRIVVVGAPDEIDYMARFLPDLSYAPGGASRQESLRNALAQVQTPYVLVSDVARCCVERELFDRIVAPKGAADCVVPAIRAVDTVYLDADPLPREKVRLIQTPQLSRTDALRSALQRREEFTDESSAIRAAGGSVAFVEGSHRALKLTSREDLKRLECLRPPSATLRTGYGIDTHPFEEGKPMVLCGVPIEADYGFRAHSDGDVAIHALIDALLGAAGMGDIGELFPDTDPRYAGADSAQLLETVRRRILASGLRVVSADLSVVAQRPRLFPYKEAMRRRLAALLGLSPAAVNVKATTSEKLGFIGRGEGVTVHAVANLIPFDWRDAR
ncbi:bifunctional 2-C-methyl-D-erythritol 4-phosphate cytidylyltransferase/2-C-methyl-D-erythritol 2,4-cyclodiphosphate synthase [Nitratifractor sp.]